MAKPKHKKVNLTSANLSVEKLAELRRILPEAFSEEKIDWDKLCAALGDDVDAGVEKFGFTWSGKSNAIKNVVIPSKATLTPFKDESVKFDDSENLFIEGDNLEVLKLLQKAYFEKVKMIYIDPPYNRGDDLVYSDSFASPVRNYLEQTGQIDSNGNKLSTNKETNGRYHSDWLSMMYPRLKLAWSLLRDDGVIFVSIDDHEVHHLRIMMNEIFGEENIDELVWHKVDEQGNTVKRTSGGGFKKEHEYILVAHKDRTRGELGKILLSPKGKFSNPDNDSRGDWFSAIVSYDENSSNPESEFYFEIKSPSGVIWKRQWQVTRDEMESLIKDDRIYFGSGPEYKNVPRQKIFKNEKKEFAPRTVISHIPINGNKEIERIFGSLVFEYSKPKELIERLLEMGTNKDGLVVDFFAGSGVTAQSIIEQNLKDGGSRNFILVQLPEQTPKGSIARKEGFNNIANISKERIRRIIEELKVNAGFKVFKLAESNYPENTFEFDPEKSEEENKDAFEEYLKRAKQSKLIDDINEVSLIYENIVKEGLSLNSKIEESKLGKNKIYTISGDEQELMLCLDKNIDAKTVSEMTRKDYKNKVFICFDTALDDTAKANLGLNLELKTI